MWMLLAEHWLVDLEGLNIQFLCFRVPSLVSDESEYPSVGHYEPWTAIHDQIGHRFKGKEEEHSAGVIFLGVSLSEPRQQVRLRLLVFGSGC
jgi:hypothetical protein